MHVQERNKRKTCSLPAACSKVERDRAREEGDGEEEEEEEEGDGEEEEEEEDDDDDDADDDVDNCGEDGDAVDAAVNAAKSAPAAEEKGGIATAKEDEEDVVAKGDESTAFGEEKGDDVVATT